MLCLPCGLGASVLWLPHHGRLFRGQDRRRLDQDRQRPRGQRPLGGLSAGHQRPEERGQGLGDPLLPALGDSDPGGQRRGPGQPDDAGLPSHHHGDRQGRQDGGRERDLDDPGRQGPGPRRGAAAHGRTQGPRLRELPQQSQGDRLRDRGRPLPERLRKGLRGRPGDQPRPDHPEAVQDPVAGGACAGPRPLADRHPRGRAAGHSRLPLAADRAVAGRHPREDGAHRAVHGLPPEHGRRAALGQGQLAGLRQQRAASRGHEQGVAVLRPRAAPGPKGRIGS